MWGRYFGGIDYKDNCVTDTKSVKGNEEELQTSPPMETRLRIFTQESHILIGGSVVRYENKNPSELSLSSSYTLTIRFWMDFMKSPIRGKDRFMD